MDISSVFGSIKAIVSNPIVAYGLGGGAVSYALYQRSQRAPLRPLEGDRVVLFPQIRPADSQSGGAEPPNLPSLGAHLVATAQALSPSEPEIDPALSMHRGRAVERPNLVETRIKAARDCGGYQRAWNIYSLRIGFGALTWATSWTTPEASDAEQGLITAAETAGITLSNALRGPALLQALGKLGNDDKSWLARPDARQHLINLKRDVALKEAMYQILPIGLKLLEENPDHPLTTHVLKTASQLMEGTRTGSLQVNAQTALALVSEALSVIGANGLDAMLQASQVDGVGLASTVGMIAVMLFMPGSQRNLPNQPQPAQSDQAREATHQALRKGLNDLATGMRRVVETASDNDGTILEFSQTLTDLRDRLAALITEQADLTGVFVPPPRQTQTATHHRRGLDWSGVQNRLVAEALTLMGTDLDAGQAARATGRILSQLVPAALAEIERQSSHTGPGRGRISHTHLTLAKAGASFLPHLEQALQELAQSHPERVDAVYQKSLEVARNVVEQNRAPAAIEILAILHTMRS